VIVASNSHGGMDVYSECSVPSGRGLYVGLITRTRGPIEGGVPELDIEASIMMRS
jgi:hypothetical protein